MIHFLCPRCQATLKVPDDAGGRKGPCPHCGQRLQVPTSQRNQTVLGILPPRQAPAHVAATRDVSVSLPSRDEEPPARTPAGTRLGCIALAVVLLAAGGMIVAVAAINAQSQTGDDVILPSNPKRTHDGSAAATLTGVGAFFLSLLGIGLLIGLLLTVLHLLEMVWIARDAKARGVDGGVMWAIIAFFVPIVGLLVYLASRPSGMLRICDWCQNRKLAAARLCPHCGRSAA